MAAAFTDGGKTRLDGTLRPYDPATNVNEAYERVLTSDVRYRFVIDTSTLG